jgi:predicted MFS family arabinose efflux permease
MPLNLSAGRWLRSILLCTALFDELTDGFLVVGIPLARDSFGISYEQVRLLFTVGAIAVLIIEPVITIASDHVSKRLPILFGMFSLVIAFALAGLTHQYALPLLAVALAYPAIGAAVGLAQAALVEQRPDAATRALAHWTLLSSMGDLRFLFLSPDQLFHVKQATPSRHQPGRISDMPLRQRFAIGTCCAGWVSC